MSTGEVLREMAGGQIEADREPAPEAAGEPEQGEFLHLILPGELPTVLVLPEAEKAALHAVLRDVVLALEGDRQAGAEQLARLNRRIGAPDTALARLEQTDIPADVDKVTDYDQFFRVRRIAGSRPANSLVQGLIQTAHAVLTLFERLDDLSEDRAQQQIDGFIAHAHLLARTLGLGRLA